MFLDINAPLLPPTRAMSYRTIFPLLVDVVYCIVNVKRHFKIKYY